MSLLSNWTPFPVCSRPRCPWPPSTKYATTFPLVAPVWRCHYSPAGSYWPYVDVITFLLDVIALPSTDHYFPPNYHRLKMSLPSSWILLGSYIDVSTLLLNVIGLRRLMSLLFP